ncbi:hypothetical protein JMJ56_29210 [Belnapia sp. T18]|uniref:Uncharacterized protein n=1 Tax=Belnapia arida TaxID=2804533 RepID=A0ABS1UD31_9PROT|nr:hypothetical protein [Belnapia arida]
MGDVDTLLGQNQLDVAQAQAEYVVEPHGMADDLGWKAIIGVSGGLGRYQPAWPNHVVPNRNRQLGNTG